MRLPSLFFLMTVTTPLAAQGPGRAGITQPVVAAAHRVNPTASLRVTSGTHWRAGMIVGAAVGLIGGLSGPPFPCETTDCGNTITFVAAIVALGALFGALIGSLFPKH